MLHLSYPVNLSFLLHAHICLSLSHDMLVYLHAHVCLSLSHDMLVYLHAYDLYCVAYIYWCLCLDVSYGKIHETFYLYIYNKLSIKIIMYCYMVLEYIYIYTICLRCGYLEYKWIKLMRLTTNQSGKKSYLIISYIYNISCLNQVIIYR